MFVSNIRAVLLKKLNTLRVFFPWHDTNDYCDDGIILGPNDDVNDNGDDCDGEVDSGDNDDMELMLLNPHMD